VRPSLSLLDLLPTLYFSRFASDVYPCSRVRMSCHLEIQSTCHRSRVRVFWSAARVIDFNMSPRLPFRM